MISLSSLGWLVGQDGCLTGPTAHRSGEVFSPAYFGPWDSPGPKVRSPEEICAYVPNDVRRAADENPESLPFGDMFFFQILQGL